MVAFCIPSSDFLRFTNTDDAGRKVLQKVQSLYTSRSHVLNDNKAESLRAIREGFKLLHPLKVPTVKSLKEEMISASKKKSAVKPLPIPVVKVDKGEEEVNVIKEMILEAQRKTTDKKIGKDKRILSIPSAGGPLFGSIGFQAGAVPLSLSSGTRGDLIIASSPSEAVVLLHDDTPLSLDPPPFPPPSSSSNMISVTFKQPVEVPVSMPTRVMVRPMTAGPIGHRVRSRSGGAQVKQQETSSPEDGRSSHTNAPTPGRKRPQTAQVKDKKDDSNNDTTVRVESICGGYVTYID